jgi:putative endonuclease
MAFTYILYSETLDRYYIGSTDTTVEDRLRKHLSDHSGFTGKAKDWIVVYAERYKDKKASMLRERQIKSWKSRVKIEELITKRSL